MATVDKRIPKKRGPGRPRKPDAANQLVPARLSKALVKNLDAWAKVHAGGSRSEAIRRLVETSLAGAAHRRSQSRKRAARPVPSR